MALIRKTRADKRIIKKNTNEFRELMKVMKHFFKDLLPKFSKVMDKRHQSYITYQTEEILFTALLGHLLTSPSLRTMTNDFNTDECIQNVGKILENEELEELPHYDTINNFLKELVPSELEKIKTYMIKALIRKRSFEGYRFLNKYWTIAVDATGIYSFKKRHCKHCLKKDHKNKETGEVTRIYYHNVLEAKLIMGDFAFSIGTEFIENEKEDVSKQDCEINAFKRLATKIKKSYSRLPITLLADSLYASEPVMDLCKSYNWEYLIRFKEGSIPTVAREYGVLINGFEAKNKVNKKTKEIENDYKWCNGIGYKKHELNLCEGIELKENKQTRFVFLSSLRINGKTVEAFVMTGRKRWKIENEGFNVLKNAGYNLGHMYSKSIKGMKNHYQLIQIAHMIRQLYDRGKYILRDVDKNIKRISKDLLTTLSTEMLTDQDIQYIRNTLIQIRFL